MLRHVLYNFDFCRIKSTDKVAVYFIGIPARQNVYTEIIIIVIIMGCRRAHFNWFENMR